MCRKLTWKKKQSEPESDSPTEVNNEVSLYDDLSFRTLFVGQGGSRYSHLAFKHADSKPDRKASFLKIKIPLLRTTVKSKSSGLPFKSPANVSHVIANAPSTAVTPPTNLFFTSIPTSTEPTHSQPLPPISTTVDLSKERGGFYSKTKLKILKICRLKRRRRRSIQMENAAEPRPTGNQIKVDSSVKESLSPSYRSETSSGVMDRTEVSTVSMETQMEGGTNYFQSKNETGLGGENEEDQKEPEQIDGNAGLVIKEDLVENVKLTNVLIEV